MDPLEVHLSIDVASIKDAIENSGDLNNNEEIFKKLADVQRAKAEMKAAQDIIDSLEREVKMTINSKAKTLYGDEWEAIKGNGYKISRSGTGAVYELIGEAEEIDPEFLDVKVSVATEEVNNYVKENSTLPEGIAFSKTRGESIRITVKPNDEDSKTQP